jgi:hypothetical protein
MLFGHHCYITPKREGNTYLHLMPTYFENKPLALMQVHNGILSPSPLVEIADNNI